MWYYKNAWFFQKSQHSSCNCIGQYVLYGPEMVVAQSLEEILGKGISVVNLNWYQWRYFPQHKLIMLENSPPIKLLKGSCMLAKHVLFSYLVYACILQNTCNLITWYAHTSYTPYYNLWFTFLFLFVVY